MNIFHRQPDTGAVWVQRGGEREPLFPFMHEAMREVAHMADVLYGSAEDRKAFEVAGGVLRASNLDARRAFEFAATFFIDITKPEPFVFTEDAVHAWADGNAGYRRRR